MVKVLRMDAKMLLSAAFLQHSALKFIKHSLLSTVIK